MQILYFIAGRIFNNAYVLFSFWFFSVFMPPKDLTPTRRKLAVATYYMAVVAVDSIRYLPALAAGSVSTVTAVQTILTLLMFAINYIGMVRLFDGAWWFKLFMFFSSKLVDVITMTIIDKFIYLMPNDFALAYMTPGSLYSPVGLTVFMFSAVTSFAINCVVITLGLAVLKRKNVYSDKFALFLIPISQMILFIYTFLMTQLLSPSSFYLRVSSFVLPISAILCVFSDSTLLLSLKNTEKKEYLERELMLAQQQQAQNMAQTNDILAIAKRQQMLNHDLRNLLLVSAELLENNEIEEAKKYFTELTALVHEFDNISYCENQIANALINNKARVAHNDGITLETDVALAQNISINFTDIASIFTNILDNAINALKVYEGEKEKKITLKCREVKGYLLISAQNPCNEQTETESGEKDPLHGFGINILKFIAQKYNGSYSAVNKDGYYTVKMSVPCLYEES